LQNETELPFGERAKNVCSISLLALQQYYLVAMAMSLEKLENIVQIHHRHLKRFHMVKDCKNRSSKSRDIPRKTPNHDVNTQRNFD